MFSISGASYHEADVRWAVSILRDAPFVMVKQPLARAGNPLAGMDYHAIARAEVAVYPGLRLAPGTRSNPTPHVKTAVIHYLDRVLKQAATGSIS
jgi:hypothetical protein